MTTWCSQHQQTIYKYRYDKGKNSLILKFNHDDHLIATNLHNNKYYLKYTGNFGNGYSIFETHNLINTGGEFIDNRNNVNFIQCVSDLKEVKSGKPKHQRKSRRKSRKSKQTRRK